LIWRILDDGASPVSQGLAPKLKLFLKGSVKVTATKEFFPVFCPAFPLPATYRGRAECADFERASASSFLVF